MASERIIEQSDALHARVGRLIDGMSATAGGEPRWHVDETELGRLALEIARFQAENVAPIAQHYASLGIDPASLGSVDEVAALPADLFRLRRVAAHPAALDARVFRTSGTTLGGAARGVHPFRVTSTMARAALAWAAVMLWPDAPPKQLVVLCPPEPLAPDSSLSFMLARFAERLAPDRTSWHFDGARLDIDGVVTACAQACANGEPTLVAGTAFAFAALLERTSGRVVRLPPESRLMPTGGFKGRAREIGAPELRRALADRFGLPESHVVGEYGMTELSSQLYEGTLVRALGLGWPDAEPGCFYPPPWVRVRALDPISREPLPTGGVGLGAFTDLANVDSSLAIVTADLVCVRSDGGVELRGRAAGAMARGCSLTVEEALDDETGRDGGPRTGLS